MNLSFDVGTKNLAYCITDADDNIVDWKNLEIKHKNHDDLPTALIKLLDQYPNMLDVTTILVEKQPNRNAKMRMVESMLHCYFIIKGVTNEDSPIKKAIVYSSKNKLGKETFKGKSNYKMRKCLSVSRCREYIKTQDEKWQLLFEKSRKKDDLADCLLQTLSYTKNKKLEELSSIKFNLELKIVARKPTDKQHKKGYSQSNLKYLFHENADIFETTKKASECAIKLFGTVENAKKVLV